ncbi:YggS family pyridoxal phosphate-dependent enzyme [Jiangella asiatica]|uniref:Pyridoxal phosphate homeostasis protein n=1 Tax=Jiangella asiatica TaxID=2530372 RepID=A0A4V6PFE6_9ACTN|nr:YggS family pyridoxal phosphate-dependent enzyme [Jiangella asiatica]TDE01608.1 YggS family pyridoxal phosphate-dependent enzyme [Jiangella asiatica]
MLAEADIRANLAAVRARVDDACRAAGRRPDEVEVLLATKTQPAARVAVAVAAGARLIGENRVQELAEKDAWLASLPCERHFIGHLQTNKVNQVLRYVSCVQSVDRPDVADRLQRRLAVLDQVLDVLVQVNTSGEDSKFGVAPADAVQLIGEVAKHDRLRVRGLMTVGLQSPDAAAVRASYRALREIRDRARDAVGLELPTLSMGMSGDLESAVAEGATMVRVGSAVFGPRPRPAGR